MLEAEAQFEEAEAQFEEVESEFEQLRDIFEEAEKEVWDAEDALWNLTNPDPPLGVSISTTTQIRNISKYPAPSGGGEESLCDPTTVTTSVTKTTTTSLAEDGSKSTTTARARYSDAAAGSMTRPLPFGVGATAMEPLADTLFGCDVCPVP